MPEVRYGNYHSSTPPTSTWSAAPTVMPVSAPPQIVFSIRKPDAVVPVRPVVEERLPLLPDAPSASTRGRGGRRGRTRK